MYAAEAAKTDPEKPAIVMATGGEVVTFGEYEAAANAKLEGKDSPGLRLVPVAEYWVSGPKKDGSDRHFGGRMPVIKIDEDVREEYWTKIREQPENVHKTAT